MVVASFFALIADAVETAVAADPLPSADGVLGVTTAEGSLLAGGATVPGVQLLEADLTAAAAFGGDRPRPGRQRTDPGPDEVVLVAATARELGVGPGGRVTLVAWGQRRDHRRASCPAPGWPAGPRTSSRARSAFVAPGTLQTLAYALPLPDGAAGRSAWCCCPAGAGSSPVRTAPRTWSARSSSDFPASRATPWPR